jgi:hypothetical protein
MDKKQQLAEREKKYKVSTLRGVQMIRNMGYDKIQSHLKQKMNKTGVDWNFKNVMITQKRNHEKMQIQAHFSKEKDVTEHMRHVKTAPSKQRGKATNYYH